MKALNWVLSIICNLTFILCAIEMAGHGITSQCCFYMIFSTWAGTALMILDLKRTILKLNDIDVK